GYHLTHKELLSIASSYPKVKIAQKENKSLGELLELMKEYSSDKKEGWVIRIDDHFVKIKCDDYVNMHRILDSVSSENVIIKAIADGEYDDLLSKVPDAYRERVEKTANEVFNIVDKVHKNVIKYYQEAPKEEDRKSTRLNSSHVSISYAVFCLKKKNNYIHSLHINICL